MTREQFDELYRHFQETGDESEKLKEYKVDNAIILAADGLSVKHETIYAPPKGLLEVDCVPIIERQIQQLLDVGISEIYVVVGYKMEMFFYLEEKYGVSLIANSRLDLNNIYSLYLAKDKMRNSYICASDYYYKENPFSSYEFRAYHATASIENTSNKTTVSTTSDGRIVGITAGGKDQESINGLAYFDKAFSETFVGLMEKEINKYRVGSLFWEEFFVKHIDELDLYIKHFNAEDVKEVDDLQSLKTLDALFVNSISEQIVKNICEQLGCRKADIGGVELLEAGHSNITFKIFVDHNTYVYRYPGVSGKKTVSREAETYVNTLAKKLDIDKTLIFIDKSGHKLSRFVPNMHPLNKENSDELTTLAKMAKMIHDCEVPDEVKERFNFDPVLEADRFLQLASHNKDNLFEIFKDIRAAVLKISENLEKDNFPKALCHGNLNSNNCLITENSFDLIDWEFARYCDIAFDFPFLGDYEFKTEDLSVWLECYYQRKPTEMEFRHWLGYRAIQYWYVTCLRLYKESININRGRFLLLFYKNCKKAIELYNS